MKRLIFILTSIIFFTSCNEPKKTEKVKDVITVKTVSKDSLINELYQFAEPYFKINSVDSIIALKGKPNYVTSIPWGEHVADSLLTVHYNFLQFNFWKSEKSNLELEGVNLLDKKVVLPGNLSVGKTTRQDILQNLGLPDSDHNDLGRSMTKSGDTTVYGTQSNAGDTVTFTYYINIDEYAIGLAMVKDTLRKVSWSKNPY